MNILREDVDKFEILVDEKFWLLLIYGDMLFNV